MLAVIAVLTLVALGSLMKLRFDTGETYPHYSSQRADPLGTRALFDALNRMPGITAERNFQKLDRMEGKPGQALLLCGLDANEFDSAYDLNASAISRFVVSGGRLIVALTPDVNTSRINRALREAQEDREQEDEAARKKKEASEQAPPAKKTKPAPEQKASPEKPKDKDKKPDKKNKPAAKQVNSSLAEALKITAKSKEFFFASKEGSPLTPKPSLPLQADEIPRWHSNMYLDDTPGQDWQAGWRELVQDDAKKETKKDAKPPVEPSPWQTLATKGNRIMIAQRQLGSGTVVVCTDRFFLSNEALWSDPKPAFLSWLLGDAKHIIFEETHLGPAIGDEDGIMTLARRYRMHGLFLGGILLFALFIWRNAFSLVPSTPEDDLGMWRADAIEGRSAASGLEGLLRRGIAPNKLLQRCFDVWQDTRAAVAAVSTERRAKAAAVISQSNAAKQPIATYRALRDALHNSRK